MRRLFTGILTTTLLLLNTVVMICPLLVFALLKLVLPGRGRDYASWAVMWIAETWSEIDKVIFSLCIPTQWDIRGVENLRRDTSYLAVSNHQTWVDIPALIESLNRRTPFFKFFLKKELIWVPLLGLAWWGLDYPFMKRYSKAFLEKHPELKGKDLEITKAACELFKRQPVTVVNYLEGTRFTEAKRQAQQSPYRYLLKPKAGGVAFVLAALGEQLDALLDVTIVYPGNKAPGFWDLLNGSISRVIIDIQVRELDPALWAGDYENDPNSARPCRPG
ncbi:putative acyltransferase YihG [Pseudomonas sp. Teo4]|nr:putative acyltransferase YihG [Pseudomonas sp. Teo4]